jgi:uncharacterized membrane protein YgaE (UPF0421/DUF939 family)
MDDDAKDPAKAALNAAVATSLGAAAGVLITLLIRHIKGRRSNKKRTK